MEEIIEAGVFLCTVPFIIVGVLMLLVMVGDKGRKDVLR